MALRQQGQSGRGGGATGQGSRGRLSQCAKDASIRPAGCCSEIEIERALIAEARGDRGGAVARLRRGHRGTGRQLPGKPGAAFGQGAQGGLPGPCRRRSPADAHCSMRWSPAAPAFADSGTALRNLLGPYFDLLAADGGAEAAAAMFRASQLLQRPGRRPDPGDPRPRSISAGNDEGSALFRLARRADPRDRPPGCRDRAARGAARADRGPGAKRSGPARRAWRRLRADQVRLQARLNDYPRYKVLTPADGRACRSPGRAPARRGLLQDDGGRR